MRINLFGIRPFAFALTLLICSSLTRALDPQAVARATDGTVLLCANRMSNMSDLGAAFCVTHSGVYVSTYEQGVRIGLRGKAVLWPGQPREQLADATILRKDPAHNLVLVKIEGTDGITPLELADDTQAYASMEVASVGFDFKGGARVGLKDVPAVRVLTNHVTSLIASDGTLNRMMLDKGPGYGQSGAAVLDPAGRVIGVFTQPSNGPNLTNYVIPISVVKKLLAEPVVSLVPSEFPYERRNQQNQLTVKVTSLLDPSPRYEAELSVHAEGDQPLVLTSPVTDGTATFLFVPSRNTSGSAPTLTAHFPKGSVSGTISGSSIIHIGDRSLRWDALVHMDRAEGSSEWVLTLGDGSSVRGAVDSLRSVPLNMGELNTNWDLSKARSIQIAKADSSVRQIAYTLTIRAGDKVVSESSGSIPLTEPRPQRGP